MNQTFVSQTEQSNSDLPIIILKVAQTLDGKIATSTGDSKWISNEESRLLSHKLRLDCDAVLVGATTILKDNPQLNVRIGENVKYIWRVIVNSKEKLSLDMQVFSDEGRKKTILITPEKGAYKIRDGNLKVAGINVHSFPLQNNSFDFTVILKELKKTYNINKILIEGGAKTLSTFLEKGLFDEVHLFIAPKIFGEGKSVFSGFDARTVSNSVKLKIVDTKIIKGLKDEEDNIYVKLNKS